MQFTRKVRKRVTIDLLRFGERLARQGDFRSVERLRRCLLWFTKIAIPLRQRLKENICNAGIDPDGLIDAYFERAADQLIMLAHGFRADFDISFVLKSFRFDDSLSHLEQAKAKGKGVMIIAPHLCSYPSVVCVISTRIPCAVYSRKNRDSRKVEIMDVLAKTGEVEVIYRPEDAIRTQRLLVAVDVLRQGKMLFITPDTPRKPHQGVPVSILGKTAYFPTGAFIMSLRTGAPVVPVWWHWEEDCYHIRFGEPIELSRGGSKIRDKAEEGMKQWACQMDAFIREHPDMWWNWLDKRWTHILRDGSRSE